MQLLTRFLLPLFAFCLVSCDSSNLNEFSVKDLDGPEGEAVIRLLLPQVPAIDPEVPKVYTPVKGPNLSSMNMEFIRRLADMKVTFISGEVLKMTEPDRTYVDPRSGLAPVVLQVMSITRKGDQQWEVVAAWSYKKTFERSKYLLKKSGETYELQHVQRLEGNFER